MQVFIIDQGFNHSKRFQIMTQKANCFYHVYPGKLFTLEEAKTLCKENNFNVVSIGSIWQCATK
jgi:hypothetical protein